MWLSVDRIEENTVVLMDDDEVIYHLSAEDYTALTGRAPTAHMLLDAQVENGVIVAAACSDSETRRRLDANRARLQRLINRKKQK